MAHPPSASHFIPSLLHQLHQATGGQVGVFVTDKPVLRATLLEAGFDFTRLSQYGQPSEGWYLWGLHRPHPDGMARRAWRALQQLQHKQPVPLVVKGPHCLWGLTEAGVEAAKALPRGSNLTATYLGCRMTDTGGPTGTFYNTLAYAVTKKLPLSANRDRINDHIQTFLAKLITRDSLRGKLLAGERIQDSLLGTYAVRSAYSDCRDWGTEPIEREFYGARTETERYRERVRDQETEPEEQETPLWGVPEVGPLVTHFTDQEGEWDVEDLAGSAKAGLVDDRITWEAIWSQVRATLKARHIGQAAEILRLHGHEDMTVDEIGVQMGLPTHRVSVLLAKAQKIFVRTMAENGLPIPESYSENL